MTSLECEHIDKMVNGSHAAFEALYKMYASKLYRYAYSFLKDKAKTEDLVQEIFIALWNNRSTIRNRDSLASLLFIMVKNRLVNGFRATINSPVFEDYTNFCNELHHEGSMSDSIVDFEDFYSELQIAKKSLNATQMKIFTLSKEEGLKNKEVAEYLNISEQTVKNQLTIALKIVREKMRKHLPLLVVITLFNALGWYLFEL